MVGAAKLMTTYESTEAPPVQNPDYQRVRLEYTYFKQPSTPTPSIIPDFYSSFAQLYPELGLPIASPDITWNADQSLQTNLFVQRMLSLLPMRASRPSSNVKGKERFIADMKRYELETGDYMSTQKEDALTKFAQLESGFRPHVGNDASTAKGYFLIIKSNRKDLGSDTDFLNNTNLLFAAASRLYDANYRFILPYWNKAKELGLSDFQIMYGCWFHPKGLVSWINRGGKDDGFRDGLGTTMTKALNRAGNLV